MNRRPLMVLAAICVFLAGLGGWVAADPPGALRSGLLALLKARGVERHVWLSSGVSGEYFEAGAGNRQAVVLLHGAGGDALSSWFSLMPALAGDYHVLAPQMAFASMDGEPGDQDHPLRLDHGGADRIGLELNGVLETMRAAKVERATVVGLSVGSWLAFRLAAWKPKLVEGVVAVAPAGPNLSGLAQRIAASGMEPGKWFYANLFHDGPPIPEMFLKDQYPVIESWVRDLQWYVDLIEQGGAGAELTLQRVLCPVEVVWGRDDRILPLSGKDYFERHLGSAKVRVLDDCGHAVVWDRPDELERAVRDFMRGEGR